MRFEGTTGGSTGLSLLSEQPATTTSTDNNKRFIIKSLNEINRNDTGIDAHPAEQSLNGMNQSRANQERHTIGASSVGRHRLMVVP